MSTSHYSEDLRKKVIHFLEKGNSQKSATTIFTLHRNTISRWWLRYKNQGKSCAKARLGYKSKVDQERLIIFVNNNPNSRLMDIGLEFGITGVQVSKILKKLGYSYKKVFSYMEANEEKRTKYLEEIKNIDKGKLV